MRSRKQDQIDIDEIDREIAEIDTKLQTYLELVQRKNDLLDFKRLAYKLWNQGSDAENGRRGPDGQLLRSKTAELAQRVLLARGPMELSLLLTAMRDNGWDGCGNDAKDKRRIYSAIKKSKHFLREGDRWSVLPAKKTG